MPVEAIPFPFGICRICQDKATGVHYGVATCEGCKGFFKRSITKGDKYKCFFGSECELTPKNRNRCKSCRFKRCLDTGMAVEAIRMGRIPKVEKGKALEVFHQGGSNYSNLEVKVQQSGSGTQIYSIGGDCWDQSNDEQSVSASNCEKLNVFKNDDTKPEIVKPTIFTLLHYLDNAANEIDSSKSETLNSEMNHASTFTHDSDFVQRENLIQSHFDGGFITSSENSLDTGMNASSSSVAGAETNYEQKGSLSVPFVTSQNHINGVHCMRSQIHQGPHVLQEFPHQGFLVQRECLLQRSQVQREVSHQWSQIQRHVPHQGSHVQREVPHQGSQVQRSLHQRSQVQRHIPHQVSQVQREGLLQRSHIQRQLSHQESQVQREVHHQGPQVKRQVSHHGSQVQTQMSHQGSQVQRQVSHHGSQVQTQMSHQGSQVQRQVSYQRSEGKECFSAIMEPMAFIESDINHINSHGLSGNIPYSNNYGAHSNRHVNVCLARNHDNFTNQEPFVNEGNVKYDNSLVDNKPLVNYNTTAGGRQPFLPEGPLFAQDLSFIGNNIHSLKDADHSFYSVSQLCNFSDNISNFSMSSSSNKNVDPRWRHFEVLSCTNPLSDSPDISDLNTLNELKEQNTHLHRSGQSNNRWPTDTSALETSNLNAQDIWPWKVNPQYPSKFQSYKSTSPNQNHYFHGNELPSYSSMPSTCEITSSLPHIPSASSAISHDVSMASQRKAFSPALIQVLVEHVLEPMKGTDITELLLKILEQKNTDERIVTCVLEFINKARICSLEQKQNCQCSEKLVLPGLAQNNKLQMEEFLNEVATRLEMERKMPAVKHKRSISDAGLNEGFDTLETDLCVKIPKEVVMSDARNGYINKFDSNVSSTGMSPEEEGNIRLMNLTLNELNLAMKLLFRLKPEHREKIRLYKLGKISIQVLTDSDDDVREIYQQLINGIPGLSERILGFCDIVPGFKNVLKEDRDKLMKRAYYDMWTLCYTEYFVNKESMWILPNGKIYSASAMRKILNDHMVDKIMYFSDEFNSLKLTDLEVAIICAIRLTTIGDLSIKDPIMVKNLNSHLLDVLAFEVKKNHPNSHSRILIDIFRMMPLMEEINKIQNEIIGKYSVKSYSLLNRVQNDGTLGL